MKLLIIEDSPLIVDRIKKNISEIKQLKVIGDTATVKEAEYLIQKEKPNIIILDIHLQGGSGLSLQYMIHSKKLNIKTVILTNYSSPILQEKSFELGTKYFLDKSRDFEKLKDVLVKIIEEKE